MIVRRRDDQGVLTKDLTVRRHVISQWLNHLKNHSLAYRNINIDQARLDQLPVEGEYNGLLTVDEEPEYETYSREVENGNNADAIVNDEDGNPATSSTVTMPPSEMQSEENLIRNILKRINGKIF